MLRSVIRCCQRVAASQLHTVQHGAEHGLGACLGPSSTSMLLRQEAWHVANRMMCTPRAQPKKKATPAELAMYGAAAAIVMIGASFAAVPLYRLFCNATGYGGTVGMKSIEDKIKQRAEAPDEELEKAAANRKITVWFNADVAEGMPWKFVPTQDSVVVKPGQSTLVFFTATNTSDKPITGYSLYMVTPDKAAQYFNKIQCFCFEEQRLRAGEQIDMPVFFYIEPEFATDWNCRNITNITLSYTFHKAEDYPEDEDDDPSIPSVVRLHGDVPPEMQAELAAKQAARAAAVAAAAKDAKAPIGPAVPAPAAATAAAKAA